MSLEDNFENISGGDEIAEQDLETVEQAGDPAQDAEEDKADIQEAPENHVDLHMTEVERIHALGGVVRKFSEQTHTHDPESPESGEVMRTIEISNRTAATLALAFEKMLHSMKTRQEEIKKLLKNRNAHVNEANLQEELNINQREIEMMEANCSTMMHPIADEMIEESGRGEI